MLSFIWVVTDTGQLVLPSLAEKIQLGGDTYLQPLCQVWGLAPGPALKSEGFDPGFPY